MNLGRLTTVAALAACFAPAVWADSIFTGTGDFNTAANWDLGLPDAATGPGVIASGSTATMSATYSLINGSGAGGVTDIFVEGTLNTGANQLDLRSGGVAATSDIFVGTATGSNAVLNVNSGGSIQLLGASADLFIGSVDGTGTLNFLDGSISDISKTIEVINGTLFIADGATYNDTLRDELVIDNNGTLAMEIDGAGTGAATFIGDGTMALELGSTSTLDLTFTTAASIGDSFVLVNGIGSFSGVVGGDGTGVFGTVNSTGLGAGQSLNITYDATGGELIATVSAVPEPGSLALLGLGGLALLRRRR